MKLLFIDCETNGLPVDYRASYEDVNNWPRVTALAWLLTETDGTVISFGNHLIKPDGWTIPTEKFWVENGYSTEKSLAEGVPVDGVIEQFMAAKLQAAVLIAHNLNFDHRIVWAEIIRSGRRPISGMEKICTMMKSTAVCRIPNTKGKGLKWPKLEELYEFLFQKKFDKAHDAMADVKACMECFFELVRRGDIAIPNLQTV
jgi:DNA polymerase-3 subunit epsilon